MEKGTAKKELIGQATDDQIAGWKNLYKDVFALIVGGHVCYVRKPSRMELSAGSAQFKNSHIGYNEFILQEVFLGGSEEIKTDDSLFYGASVQLGELVEIKESELVKL